MKTIFIVVGITGEYSDRKDWTVRAFTNQKAAEAFESKCNQVLRDAKLHVDFYLELPDYAQRDNFKHPLDPDFYCDYTGTEYMTCGPIPLDEEAS